MADSVDRVFVHALNTVKKIPRTGSAPPPAADRLRLYGLYKQAMEGDVDGVMERPGGSGLDTGHDNVIKEQEKWDAWDSQKGLSKTEAKRKYIEALIETMHKYASTTADARELVAELEFVWDQIKNNILSPSNSSPGLPGQHERLQPIQPPQLGVDAPMKVLTPRSVETESICHDDNDNGNGDDKRVRKTWRQKVEVALAKMTAEVAALREQIKNGREWKEQRRKTIITWMGWLMWILLQHMFIDMALLGILILWMRRRKDRRLEFLVRGVLRAGGDYFRQLLPTR